MTRGRWGPTCRTCRRRPKVPEVNSEMAGESYKGASINLVNEDTDLPELQEEARA